MIPDGSPQRGALQQSWAVLLLCSAVRHDPRLHGEGARNGYGRITR